jgi:hypothetical protein
MSTTLQLRLATSSLFIISDTKTMKAPCKCESKKAPKISFTDIRNRRLLDQASKIFSRGSYYAPDLARVQFLRSRILNAMGNNVAADTALHSAWKIRRSIVEGDVREADGLKQEDFDELVSFWSL